MVYDYRELVFKEILDLNPEDPFYYTKRFRKAYHLLSKEDYDILIYELDLIKARYGIAGHNLKFLEAKLAGSAGIKLRAGAVLRIVPKDRILRDLSDLDDQLDITIKKLSASIRFSGSLDMVKRGAQR